jgi:hypothetical protein
MLDDGQGPAHESSSETSPVDEPWQPPDDAATETATSREQHAAAAARLTGPPCYAQRVRTVKRLAPAVLPTWALWAALLVLGACDRDGPLDTIADGTLDAAVWRADGERIAGALPRRVGAFVPLEGADPFFTSYATGPVFGASCTYADGPRQLVVRVEGGNIRSRASAALDAHSTAADAKFVGHEAAVHGRPAAVRWNEGGRAGEVSFVVARRYLVQVRLVPAASEAESLAVAEALDVSPLESLSLDGVSR